MATAQKLGVEPDERPVARSAGRRIFAHPVILLLCLTGAVLLIRLLEAVLPTEWAIILLDSEQVTYPITVQNLMWLVFALGLGELIVRARDAFAERAELNRGYLPEDETTILQGPELRQIYGRAREATRRGAASEARFLPRLIQRVVTQFQTNRSVDQANALLTSSLELALHEIDLRYSMVRYVVWAIPTLGFIGTVVGISLALAFAGSVDLQDPNLLAELTKRLAVAFNTTLLALVMSAVLVLMQHIIQAYEERALNQAGTYCLDNLINRLWAEPCFATRDPRSALQVLSISALDLFASALGVFVLVAVLMFPYYLRSSSVEIDQAGASAAFEPAGAAMVEADMARAIDRASRNR